MNVLIADNISKTYYKTEGNISILKKISIQVIKGEILVFMGPSGSGKSTLLNILGTLDTDFTGDLTIDDILITDSVDLAAIRRDKLGFIFQFHHLLPEFTIYENLLIPTMILNKNEDSSQKIIGMLKLIGLQSLIIIIQMRFQVEKGNVLLLCVHLLINPLLLLRMSQQEI